MTFLRLMSKLALLFIIVYSIVLFRQKKKCSPANDT